MPETWHILLVEDEESHVELIRRAFAAAGPRYRLTVSTSLATAKAVLAEDPPDLVIADLMLPDGRGTELLAADRDAAAPPVVAVTSHGDEKIAVEAMKAGALDYVIKSNETFKDLPRVADRALREWNHIVERKRTEAALRDSEARYRAIVEDQTEFIVRWRPDGSRTFVNEAYCRYLGRSYDELVSASRVPPIADADRTAIMSNVSALTPDRPVATADHCAVDEEGVARWLRWTNRAIFDENGRLTEIQSVGSDITDTRVAEENRRRLEAQLRHAQKLEAVGTLAAGVAHDFNNILTAILGYTDRVRMLVPDHEKAVQALDEIQRASEQAAAVTRSLLTFSHKSEAEKTTVHLGELVAESLRMLRRMLPASIEIVSDISESPDLWVEADETQLQQVLMNLAINSRDAMAVGGHLRMTVRGGQANHARDPSTAQRPRRTMAKLIVEDTGTGMPDEVRARIFEPFFTTKARERGTGLGMAVAHGIVTEHGGVISVESRLGHGTRVTIELPAGFTPNGEVMQSVDESAPLGHGETILLAEDNLQVRLIMASALETAGYNVLIAGDGVEAVQLFKAHCASVRLLVVDMDIPRMSGRSCLQEIREQSPDLPAIVVSGRPDLCLLQERATEVVVLYKPFNMSDLTAMVSKTITARRGSEARTP